MAWSQDDERILAMIERHLTDEDPEFAARLESFSERVARGRRWRRRWAVRGGPRRSTVIIAVSWLLIAVLLAALLITAFHVEAAALSR